MDGHLPYLGWSPTNPRMVTHQKEVHYRLGIWYLDLFLSMLCGVPTPLSYVQCPHPNKCIYNLCGVPPPFGLSIYLNLYPRVWHSQLSLFSVLCGVPTPIVSTINKVCAVSPSPPPSILCSPAPHQKSMCDVPHSNHMCF